MNNFAPFFCMRQCFLARRVLATVLFFSAGTIARVGCGVRKEFWLVVREGVSQCGTKTGLCAVADCASRSQVKASFRQVFV
jgi:hypothetical protein